MIGSTVITTRYAPYARVLGRSFLDHHPGGRFAVLVADDVEGTLEVGRDFETLRPGDIGIDDAELHRRALAFDGQGLTCSMKAGLLRHLLARGEDAALLLDADSYVYGDLEPLGELARRHATVITPHSTVPHDDIDLDRMIIRTGAFNSGLLAVGQRARSFLDWWDARIARRCIPEPGTGVFNEQAWLDLVPGLFEHHVLRDPGCNASGFAMHYRDVVWRNGTPALPDGRLRHFHFLCGFDPHRPELLTTVPAIAAHWPSLKERPGLARLARDYAERLLAAGYDDARMAAAPFDRLPDGHEATPLIRRIYRDALIEADATGLPEPPNPWDAGTVPFLTWLNQPVGGPPPTLSRYLFALWAERTDLVAAFPEAPGADSAAYLAWAGTKQNADHDHIPAALAPARPEAAPGGSSGPDAARAVAAEHDRLAQDFEALRKSRSWRLTAPARFAARRLRAARGGRRPSRPPG